VKGIWRHRFLQGRIMKRLLLCFGLGVCLVATAFAAEPDKATKTKKKAPTGPVYPASASDREFNFTPGEPSPSNYSRNSVNSAPVDLSPVPATGRKKWEALLTEPADLDFGDRQTVSVKELLDGLRERHHLSLRLDIPTLSALVGVEHVMSEPKVKSPGKHEPHAAKRNSRLPVKLTGGSLLQAIVESDVDEDEAPEETSNPVVGSEGAPPCKVEEKNVDKKEDEDDCEDDESEGKAEVTSDEEESETNIVEKFLTLEVNVQTLDLQQASIATVLRQTLDAMPIVFGADFLEMPFPISLSNACLLDYLVENDGLVITTRMQALSHKETRVYSIKHLKELNAEQLAKIIRQSVRPWSWRSQINDLGDQLRGSVQIPPEVVKSIVSTGVQLAAAQTGANVTISEDEPSKLEEKTEKSDAEQLNAIGNATVNGLVTFAQATVLGLEMVHHADFPTGTIVSLPGKLIVTQSQAAHREIADLLKQLSEE
jgi:hypothetical protein